MEDMARLCDFLLVMEHGKVAMQGTPAEIFANAERLSEIGLDIPQITKLLLLLRERGFDVNTCQYTVDGAYEEVLKLLKK